MGCFEEEISRERSANTQEYLGDSNVPYLGVFGRLKRPIVSFLDSLIKSVFVTILADLLQKPTKLYPSAIPTLDYTAKSTGSFKECQRSYLGIIYRKPNIKYKNSGKDAQMCKRFQWGSKWKHIPSRKILPKFLQYLQLVGDEIVPEVSLHQKNLVL